MATKALQFDVTALDRASQTFTRMGRAVERFEKRLDRLDGKRVDAEVGVKTDKAERELGRFATDTRRKLEAAVKALPDIELNADSSDAQREMARIRSEMQALRDQRIGIDISAEKAQAEMQRLHAELQRLGRDSADIQVQADTAAAIAALKVVDAEADRLDGRKVKIKVDVDKSLSDSLIKVAQLGRALGALALPAAAVAAAPQIASIGAAAVTASGALWLVPAAASAAGVAVASLVMGFKGFGDALDDDPKKAAEALGKLAPEARKAAEAIRGLAPAWREVQQATQNALFKDLAGDLQRLSSAHLPAVKAATTAVAAGFNTAAHDTAAFLTSATAVKDVRVILDNVAAATKSAAGAAAPLTSAFLDLARVGSSRLPELGHQIELAARRFADFTDRARQSGDLGRWIDDGIRAIGQLGSITGNVAGTLGGLFRAATASGADFLGTVDQITERISAFVNSAQGQSAITSLFRNIREGVQAAAPGLEKLASAVASVVQRLADAGVLRAAGGALSAVAAAAAPMVEALGAAAPVLTLILEAAKALAPVLVPLAAGLATVKLATAGWAKAREFPNWLLSVKAGSEEAIRSNERLSRAATAVAAPFRSAADGARRFRDELTLQQSLAAAQGQQIGRLGSAMAVFETSQLGAVAAARQFRDDVRDSYQTTSAAVSGFATTAGKAVNDASVALGDRLANAASRGVEGIIRIPAATAEAARALKTGLERGVLSAALALEQLPAKARDTASTVKTALGVAAIDAGQKLRSLGTSAADAGRSLVSGLQSGVSAAVTTLRNLPTAAADAGRSLATNLKSGLDTAVTAVRTGVTTATEAVRQLPSTLGAAARSAGESVATGLRTIPDRIRNAFSTVGSAVDTGIGHLGRFASAVSGVASGAVTGLVRALGPAGLLGALGGPWGVALTAAAVGIGLLADSQQRAAQQAAEHKGRVDELASSLDKVTGAATSATRELVAQELTSVKLSDGTTSLAAALQKAGIASTDWVDATTGNQAKLEQLNGTLHAQARAVIEASPNWALYKDRVAAAGVSVDLVTDAAMGNVQAQDELKRRLDGSGVSAYALTEQLTRQLGPLGEIGRLLGAQAGAYGEAAKAAEAAKTATQDYNSILDTLKGNQVFETLARGGEVTALAAQSMDALGESAGRTAQQLGESAAKYGGVEAGAAKAAQSMAASRQAFIDAATGAGMGQKAAEELANQIGLIPAAAETIFRTNATGVAAEIITLKAQFDAVPGSKSITVQALSEDAQQKLRDLGFTVTELPDNKGVVVTANTDDAKAKLDGVVAAYDQKTLTFKLDADPSPADSKVSGTIAGADGKTATFTYDANTDVANGKVTATLQLADGKTAKMTYDADVLKATGSVDATIVYADGKVATVKLGADPSSANGTIAEVQAQATAPATKPVGADPSAANSAIAGVTASATAPATKPLLGDPGQAMGAVATLDTAQRTPQTKPLQGDNGQGMGQVQALDAAGRAPVTKPIQSRDENSGSVFAAIAGVFARPIIQVVRVVQEIFSATGGPIEDVYATGGPIRGYARGGRVTGPGTGTSDSVRAVVGRTPVRLSNGEHVITAEEVQKAGGHGAVYAIRKAMRDGAFARGNTTAAILAGLTDRRTARRTATTVAALEGEPQLGYTRGGRVPDGAWSRRDYFTAARTRIVDTGQATSVRSALLDARTAATSSGSVLDVSGMVQVLRQQVGQLRALRGDVDQSAAFRTLTGEIRALRHDLARVISDPAAAAQAGRVASAFGAW